MSRTKTGGAAFPQNTKIVLGAGQEIHQGFMGGMTLCDYFAAKVMQALLADPEPFEDFGEGLPMAYAQEAYVYADAMLRAREAA